MNADTFVLFWPATPALDDVVDAFLSTDDFELFCCVDDEDGEEWDTFMGDVNLFSFSFDVVSLEFDVVMLVWRFLVILAYCMWERRESKVQ